MQEYTDEGIKQIEAALAEAIGRPVDLAHEMGVVTGSLAGMGSTGYLQCSLPAEVQHSTKDKPLGTLTIFQVPEGKTMVVHRYPIPDTEAEQVSFFYCLTIGIVPKGFGGDYLPKA